MADYIAEYNQLRQTQESIFQNPEVRQLLKEKALQDKTLLSPFTVFENSIVGVTANHLITSETNGDDEAKSKLSKD